MTYWRQFLDVGLIFLRLGLTSFGGPVAHLGYFHNEFVVRRAWYSEQAYADMVALCQFLPGPTSSQVGMMIGLQRAGYLGACIAWLAFTLPSAILLLFFALGLQQVLVTEPAWLHGLKLAAVAVVIQAVITMMRSFCRTPEHIVIMLLVAAATLLGGVGPSGVYGALLLSAIYGMWRFSSPALLLDTLNFPISTRMGWCSALLLVVLWWGLASWAQSTGSTWVSVAAALYQSGIAVFGGGHVVLALLQENMAAYFPQLSESVLLAGYGAAQAVPGPLFSVAAYIGVFAMPVNPYLGAVLGLVAIFLPAFLIVFAVVPFWMKVRQWQQVRGAFSALNAAVVGVLAAVLYDPLWLHTVHSLSDLLIVAVASALLLVLRWSPLLAIMFAILARSLI